MTEKDRSHPTKIECVDCAKLPSKLTVKSGETYVGLVITGDLRPVTPRKIDPRSLETHRASPRCTTHWRAWRNGARAKAASARGRKRAGVDDEVRQEVKDLQGGQCPCGRPLLPSSGRRLEPDADHDHELAVGHDHPDDLACPDCFRGFLCRHCNREVIGFFSWGGKRGTAEVIAALRSLADYLEDPPMRRYSRTRLEEAS